MATIFTTGTTGNDPLNVHYDEFAGNTHVIDGLAGDDVITLTGGDDFSATSDNSIDGGADFDTLVLSGDNNMDLRSWSLSGLEKIVNASGLRVNLTATQVLGLGANFQFEDTGESPYSLNIYADDGQDVSLANLNYVNWEQGGLNCWTTINGGMGDETYTAGTERVWVNANAGDDIIYGSTKHDMLYGGDGDDIIHSGGSPNGDFIDAGAGNDELWGDGPSAVSMYGGTGSDTFHLFVGGLTQQLHVHETGTDVDTVVLHADGSFTLGSLFENLTISAGFLGSGLGSNYDNVMTGNALANTFRGRNGDDTLIGGDGVDTLIGGADDDLLYGDGGFDVLKGDAGNDSLWGGLGDDMLRGGAGSDIIDGGSGLDVMYAGLNDSAADSFVFAAISDSGLTTLTRDRVFEFVAGEDKIDLSLIDADSAPGDGQFSLIGSAAFTAEGQIRLVASGANTLIQINSSGIGGADSSIMIMGVAPSALTAGDFIL